MLIYPCRSVVLSERIASWELGFQLKFFEQVGVGRALAEVPDRIMMIGSFAWVNCL
jgi:hypothetical protein